MPNLCFIFADQLSFSLSSLHSIDKNKDFILMCEVDEEATYVPHHPKKIAFLFSAMRHFCKQLQKKGYEVRYIRMDDKNNTGSFDDELQRTLREKKINKIIITEPGEWRVLQKILSFQKHIPIPISILPDDRFLCSQLEFRGWAKDKKRLRMEYFYRLMRKRYQILMDEGVPCGGQWNYDSENRQPLKNDNDLPSLPEHYKDAITKEVIELVNSRFSHHFGNLFPFDLAVTRRMAMNEAEHFVKHRLPNFGDYQDAMRTKESYLYHSRLSLYLNSGLLLPLELCQMAEKAYRNNIAPLNSAEGFIRQILGWREFVRGIYWLYMPGYKETNFLSAKNALPDFYWGSKTNMFCLSAVIQQTADNAYSHHIQRLMITGNFALLAGILPRAVCDWYLAVYADAYEWVELPNTLGMALFADGGKIASKPYAASANYIKKMSNFCASCHYDPNKILGEKACPFNALYWNFFQKNQEKLKKNPRLNLAYVHWEKMDKTQKEKIIHQAKQVIDKMKEGKL